MHQSAAASRMTSTHGTQTSPSMHPGHDLPSSVAQSRNGPNALHPPKQNPPQPGPKKNRRPKIREFIIAARQRREAQKWRNENQPVAKEDQWMCEYCEYEQIFGEPPVALIRQYEMKDRKNRKLEAERRRLLEKAKTKGRKGKKGSKAASKAAPAPPDRHPQQNPHHAPMNQNHSQGTQSEEYFDDQEDYDEDDGQDDVGNSPSGARATRRDNFVYPPLVMPELKDIPGWQEALS